MHCADDELVAHLDGELPFGKRGKVRRHLESCWQCRARAASFEKQIIVLTGGSEEWTFPERQWADRQKPVLKRRIWRMEETLRQVQPRGSAQIRLLALSGIAVALLVASLALWSTKKETGKIAAADAIAHVQKTERAIYLRPVEQVFDIRITQTAANRTSFESKLQIWSDRSTSRFASKWTNQKGALKHALWQPSADAEFVYKPALATAGPKRTAHSVEAKPLVSLADGGLELRQLEEGFMQWMESRSRTPVAFTPELAVWTENDGALATAESVRNTDGSIFVRIAARRRWRGITATLTVEVDLRTWQPRWQAIRFESADRSIELRLTSNRIRPVASSDLLAAVFQPDVPGWNPVSAAAPIRPSAEMPRTPEQPVPAMADRAAQAVEAHYVLHEVGACLGEPVKIEEETGGIRVWNLGGSSGSWPQTFTAQATLEDVSGALADLRHAPPLRAGGGNPRLPASAFLHAWALRTLVTDFSATRVAGLPERSWRLLESMLHGHMTALRRDLGTFAPNGQGISSHQRSVAPDWRESAVSIYDLLLGISDEETRATESFEQLNSSLNEIAIGFADESTGSLALSGRTRP